MKTIAGILIFFSALFTVIYLLQLAFYYSEKHGKTQIKFRTFMALYSVAPDKWELFRRNELDEPYDNPKYCSNGQLRTIYMTTLAGHIRYKYFVKNIKRQTLKEKDRRNMEFLIECWQRDIEKYKDEAQKEILGLKVRR